MPNLLETFACEGGATAGYQLAGFDVYAIDLDANRLNYNPATWRRTGDAMELLSLLARGGGVSFTNRYTGEIRVMYAEDFAAAHASPPCQFYTIGNSSRETSWPRLIPAVRELFQVIGIPFVIENVKGAAWDMVNPVRLCGCMFDLSAVDDDGIVLYMQRERLFEVEGFELQTPRACDHSHHEWVGGAYSGARRDKYEAKYERGGGYVPPNRDVVAALLGIKHPMTWRGLFESIPPSFAEYIGGVIHDSI